VNERVRVRTRSYTCRVTRGFNELNHARQSSRSVRTPRVWILDIDTVYSIRFDSIRFARWMFSRIVASRVVTRNAFIFFTFTHSFVHPSTRTYLVDVDVLVQVCTRSSLV